MALTRQQLQLPHGEADAAAAQNVTFRWRPFNVRHVMIAQDNSPFKGKLIKTALTWRDIASRARALTVAQQNVVSAYPHLKTCKGSLKIQFH